MSEPLWRDEREREAFAWQFADAMIDPVVKAARARQQREETALVELEQQGYAGWNLWRRQTLPLYGNLELIFERHSAGQHYRQRFEVSRDSDLLSEALPRMRVQLDRIAQRLEAAARPGE